MKKTTPILLLMILLGTACAPTRSGPQHDTAANSGADGAKGGRRSPPVNIEIRLDSDVYGFNDLVLVDVMNVADHDVALWGLCNLQVQGRSDDQWHRVWFVDCSKGRLATTWVAPGETVQYSMRTKGWSQAAFPDYEVFVVSHMGAFSETFRLDSKRR